MQKTFKFKTWSENEGSFVVPGSFEYEKDENNVVTVFSVESEGVLLEWNEFIRQQWRMWIETSAATITRQP